MPRDRADDPAHGADRALDCGLDVVAAPCIELEDERARVGCRLRTQRWGSGREESGEDEQFEGGRDDELRELVAMEYKQGVA